MPGHFSLERHFGVSWAVQRLPGVLDKSESGGKAKTSRNRVRGLKNRCLGIAKFRNKAPNRSRETLPAVPKSAQMQAQIRIRYPPGNMQQKGFHAYAVLGRSLHHMTLFLILDAGPCTVFLARVFSVFGPGNQIGIPTPKNWPGLGIGPSWSKQRGP